MIKLKDILFYIIMLVALIITIITFPSCKEIQYVPVQHHDTTYVNNYIRDSIKEKDSVYVYHNQDTVYIYREKLAFKDRLVHDTVYKSRTDTLTVVTEKIVEKQVEKKLGIVYRVLIFLGLIFLILIILKLLKFFKS